MKTESFGSRARVATLLQRVADATTGNRDGIVGNETVAANVVLRSTPPTNPVAFIVKQSLSMGLTKRADERRLSAFLDSVEATWARPISNIERPAHVAPADWAAFRVSKAAVMLRFDLSPENVTDMIVSARGSVDGVTIAPRNLFVQRFAPRAPANGKTLVFAPGYSETGRTYVEQAMLACAAGYEVLLFDQQWLGLSEGRRGAVDRGFGVARDIAAVTAKAAADATARQGYASVTIVGTSMGGMGAFTAIRMNELGRVALEGDARMPTDVAAVLQSPYFAANQKIAGTTRFVNKIPCFPEMSLPRVVASKVTDDVVTEKKLVAHTIVERINGRVQAFHAPDADIARLGDLLRAHPCDAREAPIYVLHGERDPLADYPAAVTWVERMGGRATLVTIDSMNHAMAENPAQQHLFMNGLAWVAERQSQRSSGRPSSPL